MRTRYHLYANFGPTLATLSLQLPIKLTAVTLDILGPSNKTRVFRCFSRKALLTFTGAWLFLLDLTFLAHLCPFHD
jgi:hypothetical protein